MKRTVIVYASRHHGNTRKLVQSIAEFCDIALIDAEQCQTADITQYDLIGFASGIDFGRFYQPVEAFLKKNLPARKSR